MSEENHIAEDARTWVLRVQSGDMSQAEEATFNNWLVSDEAHRAAFERELSLWQKLEALEEDFIAAEDTLRPEEESPAPSHAVTPELRDGARGIHTPNTRRVPLGIGAALAAMVTLFVAYFADDIRVAALADASTWAGQTQVLTLPDGSRATLNTETAVSVDYSKKERRIRLLRGEAYFEVEKDLARPFRVEALGGVSEAVGTAFSVKESDDTVIVTVAHGKVSVLSSQTGSGVPSKAGPLLGENTQIAYGDGSRGADPHVVDATKTLSWLRGKIVFEDLELSKALEELERYYTGRIVLARQRKSASPISGIFETNEIEHAVRAVAAVHSLSVLEAPGGRLLVLY